MEAAIETASVVVIGHDITDAHLAQQQAIETARLAAIGQMTATIAHEGRNALQRMAAGLERLTWRVSDKPELLEIIGRVRAAKKDLTRLFDDVRTYAAPVQLELADCDLRDLWQTAWKHSTDAIPQKRATLQEQADGIDMHCLADPFRIDQLFRNIFDNALTACPEPARVEIACVATNDTGNHTGAPGLRIAIRDNGPGFTAEQRRRIFEPFYTTKTHGSGLGMTIAKRIVESHGGAIALGDAPSGAEFLITLPRSPS